jgi:hypothetical protein
MTEEEQLARNHPGFPLFCDYADNGSANSPSDCEFDDWKFDWDNFVAGWSACLKFNGLV